MRIARMQSLAALALVLAACPKAEPKPLDLATAAIAPAPAPGAGAMTTASGLVYEYVGTPRSGPHPTTQSKVTVHYTGWTMDGQQFDSSRTRGLPVTFPLGAVIAGWTEGVQLMASGDRMRLWIPQELAYQGVPGRPAGMLVFDVELVEFTTPVTPVVPPDVAGPPADATVTASGLAYRVLRAGLGQRHPGPTSVVKVHYTGWTTDGAMFDSSVARGAPASFPLDQVIAGWTEGVQLMVVGEQLRLWVPQDLAYEGRVGPPAGMLVFDIELLAIED